MGGWSAPLLSKAKTSSGNSALTGERETNPGQKSNIGYKIKSLGRKSRWRNALRGARKLTSDSLKGGQAVRSKTRTGSPRGGGLQSSGQMIWEAIENAPRHKAEGKGVGHSIFRRGQ